jgi:hypothetical protein
MTPCIEEGLLQAYIDDELPSAERERVQAHLSGCPACTTRARELRATAAHIGTLLATYSGTPDARTALATAMQLASIAPASPAHGAANLPTAPTVAIPRGVLPRRGWGLAMTGVGVAAMLLLVFWLSGMFQAASTPGDLVQFNGVPADPLSRPADSRTPLPAGQALSSFVPQGKVRHLVFEETTEGATQPKVTEEVWLTNGPDHPLLYRTVSPPGDWQLVGKDAVWTYLAHQPRVQMQITRLTGIATGGDVIFKTAYDPLHFDRYVASERSIDDILHMPGASMTASANGNRPTTLLEYTRGSFTSLVPAPGSTPILDFASLSTDGNNISGWEQPLTAYDQDSGLMLKVAPMTPEVYQMPVPSTPDTGRPVPLVDVPVGEWQATAPQVVECRIWLDKDAYQVLQQTTTRRLSGIKRVDNGTPVPVEQTIVETRKLVVDELLDPAEVPADIFEPQVPEGFQVMELGHTFTRVLPTRPTPAFLPTVTPIPYMGSSADPSPPSETVVPAVTSDVPLVINPPGVPFRDTGWYLFTHPEGLFEVLFPRAVVDWGSHGDTSEYGVKDGNLTYMVTYRPVTTMQPGVDPQVWLDGELPSIVASLNGILRDQHQLPATKGAARELTIERHDGRFTRARIYLHGQRLYSVFAIAQEEIALSSDEVVRYLDSFRLLQP